MKKRWQVKHRKRIDEAIKALSKGKFWEPEDDRSEQEKEEEHQALMAKVVQYYHLGRPVKGYLPIKGSALYYVAGIVNKKKVKLLHPFYLEVVKISRRMFEKGITEVWWPLEFRKSDLKCDVVKLADNMVSRMKDLAERGKRYPQKTIRRAVADLKGVPISEVPKYQEPTALEIYQKERRKMKKFQKAADTIVRRIEKQEKTDKGTKKADKEEKVKKGKHKAEKPEKKSKKEKAEKPEKKAKGSKNPKKQDFREFKPLKGKTARVAVVNFMAKHKKAGLEKLRAYAEKHAGRTVTDARIRKRVGDAARFFKKFGMTLAIGKGDKVTLS